MQLLLEQEGRWLHSTIMGMGLELQADQAVLVEFLQLVVPVVTTFLVVTAFPVVPAVPGIT
jgi:hypothetical protein